MTDTYPPIRRVPPNSGAKNEGNNQSAPTDGSAAARRAVTITPAIPASKPDNVWATIIARFTGTPDISAANGFAPLARICRPITEYLKRINSAAADETGYEKHGRVRAQEALLAKDVECCRKIAEGLGFGENQHQTKKKAGGGQGDDETVDAGFYHQHSVQPSHDSASYQATRYGNGNRKAQSLEQITGGHDCTYTN